MKIQAYSISEIWSDLLSFTLFPYNILHARKTEAVSFFPLVKAFELLPKFMSVYLWIYIQNWGSHKLIWNAHFFIQTELHQICYRTSIAVVQQSLGSL